MVNFLHVSLATATPPVKVETESTLSQAEFFMFLADGLDLSDKLETIESSITEPLPQSRLEHVKDEESLHE